MVGSFPCVGGLGAGRADTVLIAIRRYGSCLVEHGIDMIVSERVENVAAVAAELDQVRLLKRAQLVRHRRLRGRGRFGDVSHAELAAHEGIENLDARGVAEDLEQVGKVVEKFLVGKVLGRAGGGDDRLGGSMPVFVSSAWLLIAISFHMNMRSYNLLPII